MKKLKLEIEMRPSSTWGVTLARLLPKEDWDEIRTRVYREADYECAVCGSVGRRLNCHEIWVFDDKKKIQRLAGLECCCTLCHDVHHFGRSRNVYSATYQRELVQHWCKVNKATPTDFQHHLDTVREETSKRSDHYYVVKVGKWELRI